MVGIKTISLSYEYGFKALVYLNLGWYLVDIWPTVMSNEDQQEVKGG